MFVTLIIVFILMALLGASVDIKNGTKKYFSGKKSDDSDNDPFTGINNAGMPGNIWSDETDDLHKRHLHDD